jgi:ribosomal protein L37AE/L43A
MVDSGEPQYWPTHEHKFVHIETKRTRGRRPSFGLSPAVDWRRVDIFFCEKCGEMMSKIAQAPYTDHPHEAPAWW